MVLVGFVFLCLFTMTRTKKSNIVLTERNLDISKELDDQSKQIIEENPFRLENAYRETSVERHHNIDSFNSNKYSNNASKYNKRYKTNKEKQNIKENNSRIINNKKKNAYGTDMSKEMRRNKAETAVTRHVILDNIESYNKYFTKRRKVTKDKEINIEHFTEAEKGKYSIKKQLNRNGVDTYDKIRNNHRNKEFNEMFGDFDGSAKKQVTINKNNKILYKLNRFLNKNFLNTSNEVVNWKFLDKAAVLYDIIKNWKLKYNTKFRDTGVDVSVNDVMGALKSLENKFKDANSVMNNTIVNNLKSATTEVSNLYESINLSKDASIDPNTDLKNTFKAHKPNYMIEEERHKNIVKKVLGDDEAYKREKIRSNSTDLNIFYKETTPNIAKYRKRLHPKLSNKKDVKKTAAVPSNQALNLGNHNKETVSSKKHLRFEPNITPNRYIEYKSNPKLDQSQVLDLGHKRSASKRLDTAKTTNIKDALLNFLQKIKTDLKNTSKIRELTNDLLLEDRTFDDTNIQETTSDSDENGSVKSTNNEHKRFDSNSNVMQLKKHLNQTFSPTFAEHLLKKIIKAKNESYDMPMLKEKLKEAELLLRSSLKKNVHVTSSNPATSSLKSIRSNIRNWNTKDKTAKSENSSKNNASPTKHWNAAMPTFEPHLNEYDYIDELLRTTDKHETTEMPFYIKLQKPKLKNTEQDLEPYDYNRKPEIQFYKRPRPQLGRHLAMLQNRYKVNTTALAIREKQLRQKARKKFLEQIEGVRNKDMLKLLFSYPIINNHLKAQLNKQPADAFYREMNPVLPLNVGTYQKYKKENRATTTSYVFRPKKKYDSPRRVLPLHYRNKSVDDTKVVPLHGNNDFSVDKNEVTTFSQMRVADIVAGIADDIETTTVDIFKINFDEVAPTYGMMDEISSVNHPLPVDEFKEITLPPKDKSMKFVKVTKRTTTTEKMETDDLLENLEDKEIPLINAELRPIDKPTNTTDNITNTDTSDLVKYMEDLENQSLNLNYQNFLTTTTVVPKKFTSIETNIPFDTDLNTVSKYMPNGKYPETVPTYETIPIQVTTNDLQTYSTSPTREQKVTSANPIATYATSPLHNHEVEDHVDEEAPIIDKGLRPQQTYWKPKIFATTPATTTEIIFIYPTQDLHEIVDLDVTTKPYMKLKDTTEVDEKQDSNERFWNNPIEKGVTISTYPTKSPSDTVSKKSEENSYTLKDWRDSLRHTTSPSLRRTLTSRSKTKDEGYFYDTLFDIEPDERKTKKPVTVTPLSITRTSSPNFEDKNEEAIYKALIGQDGEDKFTKTSDFTIPTPTTSMIYDTYPTTSVDIADIKQEWNQILSNRLWKPLERTNDSYTTESEPFFDITDKERIESSVNSTSENPVFITKTTSDKMDHDIMKDIFKTTTAPKRTVTFRWVNQINRTKSNKWFPVDDWEKHDQSEYELTPTLSTHVSTTRSTTPIKVTRTSTAEFNKQFRVSYENKKSDANLTSENDREVNENDEIVTKKHEYKNKSNDDLPTKSVQELDEDTLSPIIDKGLRPVDEGWKPLLVYDTTEINTNDSYKIQNYDEDFLEFSEPDCNGRKCKGKKMHKNNKLLKMYHRSTTEEALFPNIDTATSESEAKDDKDINSEVSLRKDAHYIMRPQKTSSFKPIIVARTTEKIDQNLQTEFVQTKQTVKSIESESRPVVETTAPHDDWTTKRFENKSFFKPVFFPRRSTLARRITFTEKGNINEDYSQETTENTKVVFAKTILPAKQDKYVPTSFRHPETSLEESTLDRTSLRMGYKSDQFPYHNYIPILEPEKYPSSTLFNYPTTSSPTTKYRWEKPTEVSVDKYPFHSGEYPYVPLAVTEPLVTEKPTASSTPYWMGPLTDEKHEKSKFLEQTTFVGKETYPTSRRFFYPHKNTKAPDHSKEKKPKIGIVYPYLPITDVKPTMGTIAQSYQNLIRDRDDIFKPDEYLPGKYPYVPYLKPKFKPTVKPYFFPFTTTTAHLWKMPTLTKNVQNKPKLYLSLNNTYVPALLPAPETPVDTYTMHPVFTPKHLGEYPHYALDNKDVVTNKPHYELEKVDWRPKYPQKVPKPILTFTSRPDSVTNIGDNRYKVDGFPYPTQNTDSVPLETTTFMRLPIFIPYGTYPSYSHPNIFVPTESNRDSYPDSQKPGIFIEYTKEPYVPHLHKDQNITNEVKHQFEDKQIAKPKNDGKKVSDVNEYPDDYNSPYKGKYPDKGKYLGTERYPVKDKYPDSKGKSEHIKYPDKSIYMETDKYHPENKGHPEHGKYPENKGQPDFGKYPGENIDPDKNKYLDKDEFPEYPDKTKYPSEDKKPINEDYPDQGKYSAENINPDKTKYLDKDKLSNIEYPDKIKYPSENRHPGSKGIPDQGKHSGENKYPGADRFPDNNGYLEHGEYPDNKGQPEHIKDPSAVKFPDKNIFPEYPDNKGYPDQNKYPGEDQYPGSKGNLDKNKYPSNDVVYPDSKGYAEEGKLSDKDRYPGNKEYPGKGIDKGSQLENFTPKYLDSNKQHGDDKYRQEETYFNKKYRNKYKNYVPGLYDRTPYTFTPKRLPDEKVPDTAFYPDKHHFYQKHTTRPIFIPKELSGGENKYTSAPVSGTEYKYLGKPGKDKYITSPISRPKYIPGKDYKGFDNIIPELPNKRTTNRPTKEEYDHDLIPGLYIPKDHDNRPKVPSLNTSPSYDQDEDMIRPPKPLEDMFKPPKTNENFMTQPQFQDEVKTPIIQSPGITGTPYDTGGVLPEISYENRTMLPYQPELPQYTDLFKKTTVPVNGTQSPEDVGSVDESRKPRLVCGRDNSPVEVVYEGAARIETYPWLGVLIYPRGNERLTTPVVLVARDIVVGTALDIDKMPKIDFRTKSKVVLGHNCTSPQLGVLDYNYHPDYRAGTYSALVIIQIDTVHAPYELRPICGPPKLLTEPVFHAMVLSDDCRYSKIRIFEMEYVSFENCKTFYRRTGLDIEPMWPKHVACGRAKWGGHCTWNNGAALAVKQNNRWHLVGLGVNGPGCEAPARFMDYGHYAQWVAKSISQIGYPAITRMGPNHLIFRRSLHQIQRFGMCDSGEVTEELFTDTTYMDTNKGAAITTVRYNLTLFTTMDYKCIIFRADYNKETARVEKPKIVLRSYCTAMPKLCHEAGVLRMDYYVEIRFIQHFRYKILVYGKEARIVDAKSVLHYMNDKKSLPPVP